MEKERGEGERTGGGGGVGGDSSWILFVHNSTVTTSQ